MENDKQKKNEQQLSSTTHWLPIGMCLGCSFGILLDNLALGISLGMLFGLAVGSIFDHASKEKKKPENTEESDQ